MPSDQGAIAERLAGLVAACLRVPRRELAPGVPLTAYGLDSLAAEELKGEIEHAFGCSVPDTLLLDYPDLGALGRYLRGDREPAGSSESDLMARDAALSGEIRPSGRLSCRPGAGRLLLTGATGFLGGYLLRSLLDETGAEICCVVRPDAKEGGADRVRRNLERYGIWDSRRASRVSFIEGDVALPRLGLDDHAWERVCREVTGIYHSAARVNWVQGYAALRQANVLGTAELLSLACTGEMKPFHFISSAAVCYSTWGPLEVDEECEAAPYLGGVHLGYAQSKCVAESLVLQAAQRGLPVTIHRPALIAGDRACGVSNTDDLLSRLIKAIVLMGAAPDLDWSLDCMPVDYVARAIVRLTLARPAPRISHLVPATPRHWRELVLWMNLSGYPVRLVPYRQWLERLKAEVTPGHPLRPLLPFFTREPAGEGGLTLPELFEDARKSRVRSDGTRARLAGEGLGCGVMNARLIDRYFRRYIEEGFLPPGRLPEPAERSAGPDAALMTELLRRELREPALRLSALEMVPDDGGHSIISELSSWRNGSPSGVSRYRVSLSGGETVRSLGVVVKRKSQDRHLVETAVEVAALCSDELGAAFARFGTDIGLTGSHLREAGIYRQEDPRFTRHAPRCYGAGGESAGNLELYLEDISGLELLNSADDVSGWRDEHVMGAIDGLAWLHSIWYCRERELLAQPWLGRVVTPGRRGDMGELWSALGANARPLVLRTIGEAGAGLQHDLVARGASRASRLDRLPKTLIHNDFNPRNLAFRREEGRLRLCAYDWELATVGVPQHDLAELLCFVLGDEVAREQAVMYLEQHRRLLQERSGLAIDPLAWREGFRLALHELFVDRLAMYAMIDRFCPQRFLPRILSTWHALYRLFPEERPASALASPTCRNGVPNEPVMA